MIFNVFYSKMPNIQIRISESEKEETQKVLEEMGLTFSSAAKIFFRKVVAEKKIPFEISAAGENEAKWKTFSKRKIG